MIHGLPEQTTAAEARPTPTAPYHRCELSAAHSQTSVAMLHICGDQPLAHHIMNPLVATPRAPATASVGRTRWFSSTASEAQPSVNTEIHACAVAIPARLSCCPAKSKNGHRTTSSTPYCMSAVRLSAMPWSGSSRGGVPSK